MTGFDYFLKLWRDADSKDKGILLLVFAPMFMCLGGLVFSVIYFVLFVLPSFVFRILGWGVLSAIFGAGGKYCYTYFTGKNINSSHTTQTEVIDVQFTEEVKDDEPPVSSRKTTRRKSNVQ